MRNVLLVSWLLLPIGAWAYHEGPGQDRQALESADKAMVAAHSAAKDERWSAAVREYEAALAALPKTSAAVDESVVQHIQLELNKARLESGKLGDAREALEELVEQIAGAPGYDEALLADARKTLARSQFLNTWLLRLEGFDRDIWEPEAEAARQNYRLLAEHAPEAAVAAEHRKDLEATVRLERMAMEDLQAMPLPKQCNGCCSCNGKKPSNKKKKGKPSKGASSGPDIDLGGS